MGILPVSNAESLREMQSKAQCFSSSFRLPKIASAECAFCISRFRNWTRFGVQKSDPPFQRLLRAFANWDRFRARQAAPISGPSFFSGRDFRDTRDKKSVGVCLYGSTAVWMCSSTVVPLYGCTAVSLRECAALWLHGTTDSRMYGWIAVQLHDCTAA